MALLLRNHWHGQTEIATNTEIQGESLIDVFTFMGGAELRIPEHWNVVNEVTSIMAGFEDKRPLQPTQEGAEVSACEFYVVDVVGIQGGKGIGNIIV